MRQLRGGAVTADRDPEVAALTVSIRKLTGQARTLSKGIDDVVTELQEFRGDVVSLRSNLYDRRDPSHDDKYTGQERRRT